MRNVSRDLTEMENVVSSKHFLLVRMNFCCIPKFDKLGLSVQTVTAAERQFVLRPNCMISVRQILHVLQTYVSLWDAFQFSLKSIFFNPQTVCTYCVSAFRFQVRIDQN